MNIAIDAYPLTLRLSSGITNYVRNTVRLILELDTEDRFYLYSKGPLGASYGGNCITRNGIDTPGSISSHGNTLWLFSSGVRQMKRDGIDLFWGTRQMLPPLMHRGVRTVLTSYDLVWHRYPETMATYNRLVSLIFFKKALRSADHVVTISSAIARELTDVAGVAPERISVVYPAGSGYFPLDKDESADLIASKYGVSRKYALTVSTIEPRKNLPMLLRAWRSVKDSGYQLLIAGASGWKNSAINSEYERLGFSSDEVRFLGYVPDEDMNALYSGARLFSFPSIYEGFGIPVVEAMASGTPVIVSNASSLPEVAGKAGLLLDPMDETAWRNALRDLLGDSARMQEMSRMGLEQAASFTWQTSARKMIDIFNTFKR